MKTCVFVIYAILCTANAKKITLGELQDLFRKSFEYKMSPKDGQLLEEAFKLFRKPSEVVTRAQWSTSVARSTLDCILCRGVVSTLFESVLIGRSLEDLSDTLTLYCQRLGYANENACRGYIDLNLPIVQYIIQKEPQATPAAFCGLSIQDDTDPDKCPFDDPRFDWVVELPAPLGYTVVSKSIRNRQVIPDLNVVILTDTHIDPLYEAYGVADCEDATCCRRGQKPRTYMRTREEFVVPALEDVITQNENGEMTINLGIVSDDNARRYIPRPLSYDTSSSAGYWGDYRNCDTPMWAFDNVVDTIAKNHKNIDVVYYIGDTIDHGVWETNYKLVTEMDRFLINKLRSTLGEKVWVLPAIGNHDTQPTNQFSSRSIKDKHFNTSWQYEALAEKWSYYLSKHATASFRKRGGYSMQIRPGLRVISVNNNVAFKTNWWLVYDPLDAKTHLDFLVRELSKAERNGDKVHILMHIPPGSSDLTHTWTREYNRIVNRFKNTIAAEFNGHTHSDEFKIFYNKKGVPIKVAWGGGSATSYSNYNLNYKFVNFNTRSFEPKNIITYSYNLTEANLTPNKPPNWQILYNMKEAFQLKDLTAPSIDKLVNDMVTSRKDLLDLYAGFYSKKSDVRLPSCGKKCKLDILCNNVVTVLWDRRKCDELASKYDAGKPPEKSQSGISIKSIISKLLSFIS